ncbi:Aste57867_20983 [Aphanomyces stellatus]|uniref:Aste57867_20983 protein n=1 Tax=Aphanomyces stellatus TaxID=120398 RepID=A0A485LHS7_9STRA|nr:hypothetical protein As57867_020915 [Aphanomyces stellatus]VFT97658.1 Aste57867_20983 [Aphanomyces stellatus]
MRGYMTSMLVAALCLATTASAHQRTGGYSETDLDTDLKATFFSAVSNPALYSNANDSAVCVTKFGKVYQQVVSGTNYKFHVLGCAVDAAANANDGCDCGTRAIGKYDIVVYIQSWTNTVQVTSVTPKQPHHEL